MKDHSHRLICTAVAAAVMLSVSACGSSTKNSGSTDKTDTPAAVTAAPVELAPGSAVFTDKHPLSEIDLSTERTWINDAPEYADILSTMGLDKKKNNIIKGAYLVATDDDILYYYAYDECEVDGTTKIGPYTTYEIASTTKTFTATAVFQLIERGQLSLDDTIDKFFPDFEKGKDIKIYHLLHMQSGLYDHINESDKFFKNDDKDFLIKIWFDELTDEDFIQALNNTDLKFEPGTQFSYSNTSYHLLAMIIEQVSGMGYDEYLQKNIFDVCGMEHSSSMKVGDLTSITSAVGGRAEITDNGYSVCPNIDRGDGDIHTCPADLLAFDRALKNGKLINEDSLAEMFNMDKEYGCGMMQVSPKLYEHGGNNPGFKSENQFLDSDIGNVYIIKLTHY